MVVLLLLSTLVSCGDKDTDTGAGGHHSCLAEYGSRPDLLWIEGSYACEAEPITKQWEIDEGSFEDYFSTTDVRYVINGAASYWLLAEADLRIRVSSASTDAPIADDGEHNTVTFVYDPYSDDEVEVPDSSDPLAWASERIAVIGSEYVIIDCDIVIPGLYEDGTTIDWYFDDDEAPPPGMVSAAQVAAHEFGHCTGILHELSDGTDTSKSLLGKSVMSAYSSAHFIDIDAIKSMDSQMAKWMYGPED